MLLGKVLGNDAPGGGVQAYIGHLVQPLAKLLIEIVEIAKAHDIPIEENEVLAGALPKVELGDEIPAELYKAVAEVLIFVLRLSGRVR